MDEKINLYFESPRGNIEFIHAGADRHRIALLWESERWNDGNGYYLPAGNITPAEESALLAYFSERYGSNGKQFSPKTRADFEARYPGYIPADVLDDFCKPGPDLEELKQEYFRLYNYDSRLPELFDLIPPRKLREYLAGQIRGAAANE